MADFGSVLRQSLRQRGATTAPERERIYAHARALMIRKLWSMDPPLSSKEIDDNIRSFNAAVDQVEREQAHSPNRVESGSRYNWSGTDGRPVPTRQAGTRNANATIPRSPPDDQPRRTASRRPEADARPRPDAARPARPTRPAQHQAEPAVDTMERRPAARRDRWSDPDEELNERYPSIGPRVDMPDPVGGAPAPYVDGYDDRHSGEVFEDFVERPDFKPRRRRRRTFGRLFAIGITGLTATVGLWCFVVLYPILVPQPHNGERLDALAANEVPAESRPIPAARQILAPPDGGGASGTATANSPGVQAVPTSTVAAASPPAPIEPAPAAANATTQDTFIVFDGRDPTVFDAVSDNPIIFNGDTEGGFARITSTAGSPGVRAVVGPGLAQQLAGRRVRIVVVARSSILGGAGSIRVAYESGATLSPWRNVGLSPDYQPIELIWEVPANRSGRADYVLIEPGVPGEGASADVRWIRIETLAS